MQHERVVVTGRGIVSSIGQTPDDVWDGLLNGKSGVCYMPEWAEIDGLNSHVAAPVKGIDLQKAIPRKYRRSMGRVAQFGTLAASRAIADAGLGKEIMRTGRVGLAVGSTTGSPGSTYDYYDNLIKRGVRANRSTAFLQVMSHTCAANIALACGINGRVWGPASACTSGSQSLGLGFETLQAGKQDIMLCGGAEEVHFTTAATFDMVSAASSQYSDRPTYTPRPFDMNRDGMVVGEGAGILVLERLSHAQARGATIYAEVLGFGTGCDGEHITSPAAKGMALCMQAALDDAGLAPSDVDYINGHATGTDLGDIAEAQATHQVFGDRVPLVSTKGYIGHTLGACGAIESIFLMEMMKHGIMIPCKNLDSVDDCSGPWILNEQRQAPIKVAMNNNFAFGGINTSLIYGAF